MPPGGFWFFLIGVVPVAGLTWVWLSRDREPIELGPAVFKTNVLMKPTKAKPFYRFGFRSTTRRGVSLIVGKDTIAIRPRLGPRWLGVINMMDFTFRAANCEVELRRGGRLSVPLVSGDCLVLRGTDSRGRIELVLSWPAGSTLEQVEHELIRAGARPVER